MCSALYAGNAYALRGVDGNGRGVDGNGRGVDGNGRGVDGNGRGVDANGNNTMALNPDTAACLKANAFNDNSLNFGTCNYTIINASGAEQTIGISIAKMAYQYDLAVFSSDGTRVVRPGPLTVDVQYIAKKGAQSDLHLIDPVVRPSDWATLNAQLTAVPKTVTSRMIDVPSSQELDVCAGWATGPASIQCLNHVTDGLVLATNQTGAHINTSISGLYHKELWNELIPIAHAYPTRDASTGRAVLDYTMVTPCATPNSGAATPICGYAIDRVYKCTPGATVTVSGVNARHYNSATNTYDLDQGAAWIPNGAATTAGPDIDIVVCRGENACNATTKLAQFIDNVGYAPQGTFTCPTGDGAGFFSLFWRTYSSADMDSATVKNAKNVMLGVSGTGVRKAHEQDMKYREMGAWSWNGGAFEPTALTAEGKSRVTAPAVNPQYPRYRKWASNPAAPGAKKPIYSNIRIGIDFSWHPNHEPFRACSNDASLCIAPSQNIDSTGAVLPWESRPNLYAASPSSATIYGAAWFTYAVDPTATAPSGLRTQQAVNAQAKLTPSSALPFLNQFEWYKLYTGTSTLTWQSDGLTVRVLTPDSFHQKLFAGNDPGFVGPIVPPDPQ